jgi:riboflavin synthase
VGSGWFEVSLIPETLARTNLGSLRAGGRVHVEVDLVARYLETLLASRAESKR